ncbi:MAG: LytR C-terminal domain-containing protein [Conexibacter sp.]
MPTAPASGNGHSDTFPPVPPVRRPAPPARAGAGRRPPARPAQRPAPAAPLRQRGPATATPRGTSNGNGNGASGGSPHGRRLIFLLAALGVIAVVAIAAIALTSGGSDSPSQSSAASSTPSQQTTGAAQTTPTAAPAHDKITVAVLNGTTTAGLAQRIASSLVADGFVQGPVTNASDQQRSVTVVSYFGGHEREAQEVAKALNVPSDAVQPIDPDTEQACGQGGACTATVVVTVGADRQ